MRKIVANIALSGLVLGLGTVGCATNPDMYRSAGTMPAPKAAKSAAKSFDLATKTMIARDFTTARGHAEDAVAAAPRDVGYRMLLADLYLKEGRLQSAETTFADIETLNPGNLRAGLNRALLQVALGKNYQATTTIQSLEGRAPTSDVGLAYALAGDKARAVALLEEAARAEGADGRTRQNLALAYALSGDWQKARITAAQDVSPAELDQRLQSWAAIATPAQPWTQVASLLGVTPTTDAGQPARVALAVETAPAVQLAAVEPAVETAPVVQFAAAEPVAQPAPVIDVVAPPMPQTYAIAAPAAPIAPAVIDRPLYAAAVATLFEAPVVKASASAVPDLAPTFRPAKPRRTLASAPAKAKPGRFVVQIGAYRNAQQVEQAWARAIKRHDFASANQPLSTTISLPGRGTFHRLSVSGFGTHGEAERQCRAIRRQGGACFVRMNAGDAPVRWASRYARNV